MRPMGVHGRSLSVRRTLAVLQGRIKKRSGGTIADAVGG
jgi:hypothetical protein